MVLTVTGAFAQDALQGAELDETAIGALPLETDAADTAEAGSESAESRPVEFISQEIVQPLPEKSPAERTDIADASTLGELVAATPVADDMSSDMRCLASAIYFESRGEPLLGQLAVGRVIVNRAQSKRFPSGYCGVVYQRSQFSFVRGGRMPRVNTASNAWQKAKAVAKIAHEGLWESPTKGALFFHASYVQPGWRLTRVGRVSSHIFYR